jgi:hypothetical protein
MVRLQPQQLRTLDGWSGAQEDKPSRPEAIRRMIEMALGASPRAAAMRGDQPKAKK